MTAGRAAAVECDVRNTRLWPQYDACSTEARAIMSEATRMWVNSQRGWLDKLKEARQKREACNELHNRALEEAKTCRAKREQETREAREEKARQYCNKCEVRDQCLEYALRIREPHGMWGGMNEAQRRALLRVRDREAEARRAG